MILVNLQPPGAPVFAQLDHAAWDGLTFADLVFPAFLVAVGVSTPLALDGRGPVAWRRVLRRAALLFAIGLAFNWLLHPSLDLAQLRVSGVLQRIAIAYLACAAAVAIRRGPLPPLALAGALLAAHAVLLHLPAPGEAFASLSPGAGLSGWLDRTLLPGRLRHRYDPEGVLSTLSALATTLGGAAAMRGVRAPRGELWVAFGAAAALVAGLALTPWWPLNKQLWTPSFAMVTGGATGLAWLALRRLAPHAPKILAPAAWLGRAALTFYVVHMALIAVLLLKLGGVRLWTRGYEALAAAAPPPQIASLAFALLAGAACLAVLAALARRGWVLKL